MSDLSKKKRIDSQKIVHDLSIHREWKIIGENQKKEIPPNGSIYVTCEYNLIQLVFLTSPLPYGLQILLTCLPVSFFLPWKGNEADIGIDFFILDFYLI